MKQAELKKIAKNNLNKLKRSMCLDSWTLTFGYERLLDGIAGEIHIRPEYSSADKF